MEKLSLIFRYDMKRKHTRLKRDTPSQPSVDKIQAASANRTDGCSALHDNKRPHTWYGECVNRTFAAVSILSYLRYLSDCF